MEKFEVANRISELRAKLNLTQHELARRSGVSPTYVYQLERGEKSPTVEYLSLICYYGLNITLEEFFRTENSVNQDVVAELTPEQKKLLNDFLSSIK